MCSRKAIRLTRRHGMLLIIVERTGRSPAPQSRAQEILTALPFNLLQGRRGREHQEGNHLKPLGAKQERRGKKRGAVRKTKRGRGTRQVPRLCSRVHLIFALWLWTCRGRMTLGTREKPQSSYGPSPHPKILRPHGEEWFRGGEIERRVRRRVERKRERDPRARICLKGPWNEAIFVSVSPGHVLLGFCSASPTLPRTMTHGTRTESGVRGAKLPPAESVKQRVRWRSADDSECLGNKPESAKGLNHIESMNRMSGSQRGLLSRKMWATMQGPSVGVISH